HSRRDARDPDCDAHLDRVRLDDAGRSRDGRRDARARPDGAERVQLPPHRYRHHGDCRDRRDRLPVRPPHALRRATGRAMEGESLGSGVARAGVKCTSESTRLEPEATTVDIGGNLTKCALAALAALFAGTAAGQAAIVICESQNYRNAECAVGGGPVVLIRQLSTPPGDCIEGRTWGFNGYNNTIWVTNGCRAEFRVGYDAAYPPPRPGAAAITVNAESHDYSNVDGAAPRRAVAVRH